LDFIDRLRRLICFWWLIGLDRCGLGRSLFRGLGRLDRLGRRRLV
jgi:hypothetical protein